MDDLLGKYLAGEATPEEVALVEQWRQESEGNQKYFDQLNTIFVRASAVREWQTFDTDAAWNKMKANVKRSDTKTVPIRPGFGGFAPLWRIAAGIIIVLGIGLYFYRSASTDHVDAPVKVIAQTKALSDTLPDGSPVFLNKETSMVYAFNEKKKIHEVDLKGEAFFTINREHDEQFIIHADGVFIRDIGTSFNVRAYPGDDVIEVLVEEGEVVFYTHDNPGIRLKATGKGVYNKVTKSFTIEQPEANILAYKTKFFVFNGSDLATVAEALNNVYTKKIVIPEHLKDCRVTVNFRNEAVEEIAAVIAETLGLTVTASSGNLVFSGEGCD